MAASKLMAERVVERVDEQLNCTVCLDTYTDPKILPCFHVYCQKCLAKLVFRDQQGQLSLSCPICRQDTLIPANGTAGLQSAFHMNRLLEIVDEHHKTLTDDAKKEGNSSSQCRNLDICCSEHESRDLELFCETCEELICCKCAIREGKHHHHDYKCIEESFEKYKEDVTPSLELMEKQLPAIDQVLAQLDRKHKEIGSQQEAGNSEE